MHITIIANPGSGSYNKELLELCTKKLGDKFGSCVLKNTTGPNTAGEIAASDDADLIIAAGGDGLINEVVSGVVDKNALFSALPFGTVNVYCRQFKIPLDPLKAVEKLNPDSNKLIAAGFLNARAFVLMCGFGYDAEVVGRVVRKGYKKHKTLAHIKEGMGAFFQKYPEIEVYSEGRFYKCRHLIVSLVPCYAGNYVLSKDIKEGVFNLFMQEERTSALLYSSISIALGKGHPVRPVYAETLKVKGTDRAQLDGEYIETGNLQNYLSVNKDALRILI